MQGLPFLVIAEIGIPDAGQCLRFAVPFVAVAALGWLLNHLDQILDHLFPHWEWEKQLGWLNIRAERKAEAVLRWIGYAFYALLALALLGIVWSAQAFQFVGDWNDPAALDILTTHLPVLLISAGIWLLYLGCALLPKLRHQHDREELAKFREEQKEIEELREDARNARTPWLAKSRYDPIRSKRLGPGQ